MVIVIRPLEKFEARQRYAYELMMLELTRDRYKEEMFEDCNTAPVCHRFRLDFTADIGHDRVFGVIFEVPSRIWRSV